MLQSIPFAGTPPSPQYPTNAAPSSYACECFDWGGLTKDNKIDDQDFGVITHHGGESPA
jgi:hypothetical protein